MLAIGETGGDSVLRLNDGGSQMEGQR